MEQTKEVKRKDLHSLKSGLTAVIGYIQLAQKKAEGLEQEDAKKIEDLLVKAITSAHSVETQIQKMEGLKEPLMDL